jgi:hypothetical protein
VEAVEVGGRHGDGGDGCGPVYGRPAQARQSILR